MSEISVSESEKTAALMDLELRAAEVARMAIKAGEEGQIAAADEFIVAYFRVVGHILNIDPHHRILRSLGPEQLTQALELLSKDLTADQVDKDRGA